MKKCIKCLQDKEDNEFYANRRHKSGLSTYCKICSSEMAKVHRRKVLDNPDIYGRPGWFVDRRKYSARARMLRELFPEKTLAHRDSRKVKVQSGYLRHHWSYNEEHRLDIIALTPQQHITAHRYIIYDQEQMMFRGLDGVLLDTKESHMKYINSFIM